jgi:putative peptide maturation dehydrogenase
MARRGLLVSDEHDADLSELNRRATVLDSKKWHPYAALYHFLTRSSEYQWPFSYGLAEAEAEARAQRFVAKHGAPPDPFHALPGAPRIDLPLIEKTGELYELLKRRRTMRAFDATRMMSADDLSTLLYYTYGCHGYVHISPEVVLLHRTSPSGGSRHPVEVYPLILRVEGVAPGVYHYNMGDHALERIRGHGLEEAQELAVELGGGQEHLRSAHVIFIMTARFFRNFWKYQRTSKSYGVVLMDVAHLSQTLYLIATDLNLGVVMSAAINAPLIDEVLGVDGYEEGALALCGCGVRVAEGEPDYGLTFRSFVPRRPI